MAQAPAVVQPHLLPGLLALGRTVHRAGRTVHLASRCADRMPRSPRWRRISHRLQVALKSPMYPFLDRALEICTDYFERWILGDAKDQGQVNDALSNAAATRRPFAPCRCAVDMPWA